MRSVLVSSGALLCLGIWLGCGHPSQTPPTSGQDAIESWLSSGDYRSWHCEAAPHAPRETAPHPSMDRLCSNDLATSAGAGEYPIGTSSVVELYDDSGTALQGYAVDLHLTAGTTGDSWFFYSRVPLNSSVPHDASGIAANSLGNSEPTLTRCVGCHSAAGPPSYSGHDYVFTQVH